MKMNTKQFLVSFLTIASVLLLVGTVSAVDFTINEVTVDGISAMSDQASVIAGETITIKVYFDSSVDASDVRIKAEIEGDKTDVDTMTQPFDVEDGFEYRKILTLKVPSELKDDVSGEVSLSLKIWGGDSDKLTDSYQLNVQRPSYHIDFKSITVSNSVEAGETFPVDIVLKNTGYNDLEDVYVIARLPALDLEQTVYLGDLVPDEWNYDNDDDETDTLSVRLYFQIPYDVEPGIYTLEVEVVNEDLTTSKVMPITINNDLAETVIKSGNDLIIVNPTDNVKIYRVIPESPASVSETIVVVPASSSKTVTISPNAQEYDFSVNVLSGEKLVGTVQFTGSGKMITNPIVILTVVLAIIFLVLLIVLIVLIGKKPEKSEEFGESYY